MANIISGLDAKTGMKLRQGLFRFLLMENQVQNLVYRKKAGHGVSAISVGYGQGYSVISLRDIGVDRVLSR